MGEVYRTTDTVFGRAVAIAHGMLCLSKLS